MKEALKNNKKFIIIGVFIIILLIIGIAFAYLRTTLYGEKEYVIRAGSLGLILEEDNELTLEKQIPIEDSEGMTLTGFDFRLINQAEIETDYTIYLDDIPLEEGETRMPDSAIRYSLTKNEKAGSADDLSNMGVNPNRVVDSGSIAVDETINYTLRIWIDYDATTEEASGKTFKGKLRVEASQHVIPETTKKILEDNELQEEKENMFNYASNGSYIASITEEGPQYGSEPSQVTNGLYSMNDEDGVSYYYRGAVDNNNVQFGEYVSDYYVYENNGFYYQSLSICREANVGYEDECTQVKLANAGDKMYWKIVRVNGDGSLRLIYNGTSTNPDNSDLAHSFAVGVSPYNLEFDNPKYSGYTYDNGTDSFIKKEVDTWYKNTLGDTIYDKMVNSGRFCSDSSGYKLASEYDLNSVLFGGDIEGIYLYSSWGERLGGRVKNSFTVNTPTLSCPDTDETYGGSYRLKAGLITADELTLAGESSYVVGNSYLNPGESDYWYWSMTPADFGDGFAIVWREYDGLDNDIVDDFNAVRPVINVTTENGFTSGDGTASSPYVLH